MTDITRHAKTDRGTLGEKEHHPAADSALEYLNGFGVDELCRWQGYFGTCAIEGNRLAEVCTETLNRLLKGEPVSDRYLLGLAWTIKKGEAR